MRARDLARRIEGDGVCGVEPSCGQRHIGNPHGHGQAVDGQSCGAFRRQAVADRGTGKCRRPERLGDARQYRRNDAILGRGIQIGMHGQAHHLG